MTDANLTSNPPAAGAGRPPSLRDRQRARTRQRLVDAGYRLFHQRGYGRVTAAEIAAEAGVTERTFFRHFPSKADVAVANWRLHAVATREALERCDEDADVLEALRGALRAFVERLAIEVADLEDFVAVAASNRPIHLLLLDVVLDLEQDVAREVARLVGRSSRDLEVLIVANATVGVLRAAIRSSVTRSTELSLVEAVDRGALELAPMVAVLDRAVSGRPSPGN